MTTLRNINILEENATFLQFLSIYRLYSIRTSYFSVAIKKKLYLSSVFKKDRFSYLLFQHMYSRVRFYLLLRG